MSGDRLNITVMLGGFSAEREVSLESGRAVVAALEKAGHQVHALDPSDDSWELPQPTDVVFIALHGTYGEDGQVQRRLEMLGVPYTGCDSETSALAFDKGRTKEVLQNAGLPTKAFCVVEDLSAELPEELRLPLVLKPVCQGSSVGLRFVDEPAQWLDALKHVLQFDDSVLVEEKIIGRETTVGVLDGIALPVLEVRPKQGAYDYANKYTDGATEHLCPAPFDDAVTGRIQAAALGAYRALGCRDYARIDVMVDEQGEPWILEVNTLPGMTRLSLFPEAAGVSGIGFVELCERMIASALDRRRPDAASPISG